MGRRLAVLVAACLLSLCVQGRADFKYVQSGQITGGMMAGMLRFMGHYNKQISQPSVTTTYVKGSYLRMDSADGSYRIIDINGRRVIQVNPAKQTYTVATFEQIRQMVQRMEQRANEQMREESKQKNANVTLTPKIEVRPTGRTQTLLGQNTQEVKAKVMMEVQETDAQHGTQSGNFVTDFDSWIATSVGGYREVTDFYKKLATEIAWTPTSFGMDPRMGRAMVQLYKGGKIPQGLPLLQVMSLIAADQTPPQGTQQQPSSASSSTPATSNEAAVKAIGSMLGRFGRNKEQDQDQQPTDQNSSAASNQPASNALMEITTRVVSYSTDPLDSRLFQIPSGYTEQPSDAAHVLTGSRQ